MIMRDGNFTTMMQHQEEYEYWQSTEKEQQAMASTPTGKALILVQCVLSLNHFLQYYTPQNLGVASKLTTLEIDSMCVFTDCLLHLQAVFRISVKRHCVHRAALHKAFHRYG